MEFWGPAGKSFITRVHYNATSSSWRAIIRNQVQYNERSNINKVHYKKIRMYQQPKPQTWPIGRFLTTAIADKSYALYFHFLFRIPLAEESEWMDVRHDGQVRSYIHLLPGWAKFQFTKVIAEIGWALEFGNGLIWCQARPSWLWPTEPLVEIWMGDIIRINPPSYVLRSAAFYASVRLTPHYRTWNWPPPSPSPRTATIMTFHI